MQGGMLGQKSFSSINYKLSQLHCLLLETLRNIEGLSIRQLTEEQVLVPPPDHKNCDSKMFWSFIIIHLFQSSVLKILDLLTNWLYWIVYLQYKWIEPIPTLIFAVCFQFSVNQSEFQILLFPMELTPLGRGQTKLFYCSKTLNFQLDCGKFAV